MRLSVLGKGNITLDLRDLLRDQNSGKTPPSYVCETPQNRRNHSEKKGKSWNRPKESPTGLSQTSSTANALVSPSEKGVSANQSEPP